jgi:colanic acid biosynthesis glycosyl transferase WcaI
MIKLRKRSHETGRILLIAINFYPEMTGIGKYTGEMAEWLAKRGYKVRVITAPPYYPAWHVAPPYSSWKYRHEFIGKADVWRCPLWVPKRLTGLKRILHLASFAVSSFPMILWSAITWKPDRIFVVEPPIFCAPGALLASWLFGSKSWLHVQDFEVDAAFDLGILPPGRLRNYVLALERWLICKFNRVTTISDRMLEHLAAKGVDKRCHDLFPNWVELDRIKPLNKASPVRAEWGLGPSDTAVLYSGNLGEKQGIEIIVEAARRLQFEAKIRFIICGDGAARSRIEQLAEGISNITLCDLQPKEKLNDLLNAADIHILPQRADAQDLVFPSKLTNMLASGRPVLVTAHQSTQIAEVVQNCGQVITPGDVEGITVAIKDLLKDPERRELLGKNARSVAEKRWDKNKILAEAFLV